ncbi:cleft lip and palate transmembrane protein 1-like protein [Colias croceus]|uniref:cleft lip and palate transmembrane protein 1-like protein n=1 Tax=Colias crocea TaxID=72248 RepID=UPI001E279E42|nr:cleft lip and palate transmembrane protein 1-like protein [Colias croceus]XP_045492192.1 cleft lip and palate transmembrane protein 1-like protein [Colias croceus]
MKYISFSLVISLIFAVYVINTIWNLAEIFIPPECSRGERCFSSYLSSNPLQHLVLYTSVKEYPYRNGYSEAAVNKVHTSLRFDYRKAAKMVVKLNIPRSTRNNGSLYMHAVLLDENRLYDDFIDIFRQEAVHTLPLITFMEPQAETFNLWQGKDEEEKPVKKIRPYAHISTVAPLSILTDNLNLPSTKVPGELYPYMKIRKDKFLPIIHHNVLKSRISDLELLTSKTTEVNITVDVAPTSYGVLRLALHVRLALEQLKGLGFSEKDVDDVKGIFADTNLYLLSATVLIASCHLLFDFLAFKNDVSFWRSKRSLAGLSARTVFWRAFSQLVIFFYLVDEKTSLLVLVPAGISAVIEAWKVTKVLHVRVSVSGWRVRVWRERSADAGERSTARADAEAMRYLALLLYPLCGAGALYSLLYEPHKSWYSWALHSVVNGVYAFGFLFMLPQLFVNYRLRSVAALPWRAFMYKAFNTFIDDVFAFIITMPTAHRVACFRDDLVFLVYLYQRWLYPVDKTRTDTAASMDENPEVLEPVKSKDD